MANSARRVLVTRPEPGASETAQRLEALGFLSLKLPLHEIRPLPLISGAIPTRVAAVAVTSANAVRHAPGALLERLSNLPCFAVGEATATTVRSAGFSKVTEGEGDAETLAEMVLADRPAGPVVYLCGRVRRPFFEQRLTDADVTVIPVETYDAAAIVRTAEEMSDVIGTEPVDYALIYSANAAEALVGMMRQAKLRDLFKNTIFACISIRIADVLAGEASGKILVAEDPSETALLSVLKETADDAS
jgi:uroporphyrinogen-III synthase